jgi:hypothetical protein
MDKCDVDDCPDMPVRGSTFCFLHWLDFYEGLGVMRVESITPPAHVHEGLMAKVKQEAES